MTMLTVLVLPVPFGPVISVLAKPDLSPFLAHSTRSEFPTISWNLFGYHRSISRGVGGLGIVVLAFRSCNRRLRGRVIDHRDCPSLDVLGPRSVPFDTDFAVRFVSLVEISAGSGSYD